MKQIGVSATMQTRIKFTCDSREKELQSKISVALNQWGQEEKFVLLPATRIS
jgi:hypothetical protein